MSWTKEDLHSLVKTKLAGRLFIVASNREPYIHILEGDEVRCIVPASGLTVALDPRATQAALNPYVKRHLRASSDAIDLEEQLVS